MEREVPLLIAFITEYWLKILFGLICAGIAWFVKRWYKLEIERRDRESQEKLDNLYDKIDHRLKEQKDELKRFDATIEENFEHLEEEFAILKDGVLSIQKPHFKKTCRELLSQDEKISVEQFEAITKEHLTYNKLGGNSIGDELYSLVRKKYEIGLEPKEK